METALTPRPPSLEAIASFVKLQRTLFGWKQHTLASLAGVSLSTVQRLERGEVVRPGQLTKLALALKRPGDAFTREIVPLTPLEAMRALEREASWMLGRVQVNVSPLRKEAQVRALAETHLFMPDSDMGEEVAEAMDELREWFDLASFIRAENAGSIGKPSLANAPLRQFYRSLLDSVHRIEVQHRAVCLAGTYEAAATGPLGDSVKVAVIALRSRDNNPAVAKINVLWAEGTVDVGAALETWFHQDD